MNTMQIFISLLIDLSICLIASSLKTCSKKYIRPPTSYSWTYMVCVCNSTYCDTIVPIGKLNSKSVAIYTSSESGRRLERYQSILGFGGAFTDSAGMNIASLPKEAREFLMQSYFGADGLQYTLGRVPMASCDFSTREYSYDNVTGDENLEHFSLVDEDRLSPPGWMKTNGRMKGGGELLSRYRQSWADYFVRFLDAYSLQDLHFWAVTVQNEPTSGLLASYPFQTVHFSASAESDFVKYWLGPTMNRSKVGKTVKLIALDDQRGFLTEWADTILKDKVANSYIDGFGVHWYDDMWTSPNILKDAHFKHPDKFILATEACNGWLPLFQGPTLGSWHRANMYAHSIIQDLNNYVVGWTDWNLALDEQGGPNWVSNFVDSPIIVNATSGEFYKQPMFYALGHFSKFIRPNSFRIDLNFDADIAENSVEGVAFLTPERRKVLVVKNKHIHRTWRLLIEEADRAGQMLTIDLEPQSIVSVVWNKL